MRKLVQIERGGLTLCLPWNSRRIQQFSSVPELNLNDFHGLADHILENILDKLVVVEESIDDVDISYAVQ
jgi:hypothetical protein